MNADKMVADFDAVVTTVMRTVPSALYSFFARLKDEGFTDEYAFALTRDYFRLYLTPNFEGGDNAQQDSD